MQFIMTITMNNAAFEENSSGSEVGRILEEVTYGIVGAELSIGDGHRVNDINGNTVGRWDVVAD